MNTGTCFVHTADWQIGLRANHVPGDHGAAVRLARYDAVKRIADVARDARANFVVVAGDVFEHHALTRESLQQSFEALRSFPCDVFLLPGNHDPYTPEALYRSDWWGRECPRHVKVLSQRRPVDVGGATLLPCPLLQRDSADPTGWLSPNVGPSDRVRVGVAHGGIREILQRLAADDELEDANATVAWTSAVLDDAIDVVQMQLIVACGNDRSHATFKAFFPEAPSVVTQLALEAKAARVRRWSALRNEVKVSVGLGAALDAVVAVTEQASAVLAARSAAEDVRARVSLRMKQWRGDANMVRRGVQVALDQYAITHAYPKRYSAKFFLVARSKKSADKKPAIAKTVDATAPNARKSDAKPVDAKPVDAKPAEVKPTEAKPAETPAERSPSKSIVPPSRPSVAPPN